VGLEPEDGDLQVIEGFRCRRIQAHPEGRRAGPAKYVLRPARSVATYPVNIAKLVRTNAVSARNLLHAQILGAVQTPDAGLLLGARVRIDLPASSAGYHISQRHVTLFV
jgi:hypothetical protein